MTQNIHTESDEALPTSVKDEWAGYQRRLSVAKVALNENKCTNNALIKDVDHLLDVFADPDNAGDVPASEICAVVDKFCTVMDSVTHELNTN